MDGRGHGGAGNVIWRDEGGWLVRYKRMYGEEGTDLVPSNKYKSYAANFRSVGLQGTMGTQGPNTGAIGGVLCEIEGRYWGMGANGDGYGGGLEKRDRCRFFEWRRKQDGRGGGRNEFVCLWNSGLASWTSILSRLEVLMD
jgi:hypothetical protein